MKTLLFDFDKMGGRSDAALKDAIKLFTRAGAQVANSDVSTPMRTSGISYREITFTFSDSQKVILRVKQSGDIYQVLINGKPFPIKEQDDHPKAISEIVAALDAGRTGFQKKMAIAKVTLPPGIKTAVPTIEKKVLQQTESLKVAISAVEVEINTLKEREVGVSTEEVELTKKRDDLKIEISSVDNELLTKGDL